MIFFDGYIPDIVQAAEAHARGYYSDREKVLELAAPWDSEDNPPVTTWESFRENLDSYNTDRMEKKFWKFQPCRNRLEDYFTPSQGSLPNCSGFALANATTTQVIYQRACRQSEQEVKKLNPMATWVLSKNGGTWGGQTISAIMLAGNQYGNYITEIAGEYDQKNRYEEWKMKSSEAQKRQIGFSLYDGSRSELAKYILKACSYGYSSVIGNSVAVIGAKEDENGVSAAVLGGTWSHATCFCGWRCVNDTEYVFWANSHGNIYKNFEGEPSFGCWMRADTLEKFISASFCDVAFLTYAESPYDLSIKPTLVLGA